MSLTTILRRKFDENPALADELIDAMIAHAKDGHATFGKEIWERTDGKVPDRLDLLGEVQVRVTYSDEAEPTDADA